MPIFGFDKDSRAEREAGLSFFPEDADTHREALDPDNDRRSAGGPRGKRQEISRLREELRAGEVREEQERSKHKRKTKWEIFQLKSEPGATGTLPDFAIIGGQKCGTTSLYRLLVQHPLVEPAATKELHFFDNLFGEGVEWYRRCFPRPKLKDGRKTITGEATPAYIFHPEVPERVARVIPEARLIALLRNPVDRAYSQYHQRVRKEREGQSFEEAIAAEEARLRGEESIVSRREHPPGLEGRETSYLSRGIYADQLPRWSSFLDDERLLILKSEDFFWRPRETLGRVLKHLGLPEWEPPASEIRNEGSYKAMDPATRKRLEAFFESHNRRLYEYLGVDFGW